MAVQCPRCELIFGSKNEVEWHLREDHHWQAPSSDDIRRPAGGGAPSDPDQR